MAEHEGEDDLIQISWDLTWQGALLSVIAHLVRGTTDGHAVAIICLFLAANFACRITFAGLRVHQHFWAKIGAVLLSGAFACSLIYQAEQTRAGWYRTHVLAGRVHHLVARAPAYVIVANEHDVITATSDNIADLTGYTPAELAGRPLTELMRPGTRGKHLASYKRAVSLLKRDDRDDAGWMLQGVLTVALVHRDGRLVPVRIYAGGIRWSQDKAFDGDTDMFAVIVPVSEARAHREPSTISEDTPVTPAPPPPPAKVIVPLPPDTPGPR